MLEDLFGLDDSLWHQHFSEGESEHQTVTIRNIHPYALCEAQATKGFDPFPVSNLGSEADLLQG